MIEKYKHKGKELVAKLTLKNYHTKFLHGGGIVTQLIYISDKIVMPKKLLHPRMDRT